MICEGAEGDKSPIRDLVLLEGGWVVGEMDAHFVARHVGISVDPSWPLKPGHRFEIVRAMVSKACQCQEPPEASAVGGAFAQLKQARIERGWLQGKSFEEVFQIKLAYVTLVDWTAEIIDREGPVVRGFIRGKVYAQVVSRWPQGIVGSNDVLVDGATKSQVHWLLMLVALLMVSVFAWKIGLEGTRPFAHGWGVQNKSIRNAGGSVTDHSDSAPSSEMDAAFGSGSTADADVDAATDVATATEAGLGAATQAGDTVAEVLNVDTVTRMQQKGMTVAEALAEPERFFRRCGEPIRLDADLLFDFDRETLRIQSIPELKRLARLLKQAKAGSEKLMIVGHSDPSGGQAHNQALSLRRAQRVARWLVGKRVVRTSQIEVEGRGETELVVPRRAPKKIQRLNRRVEILVKCPGENGAP
jgi:outer membrane protein OmpA-like peptidoglycan-associated protein